MSETYDARLLPLEAHVAVRGDGRDRLERQLVRVIERVTCDLLQALTQLGKLRDDRQA